MVRGIAAALGVGLIATWLLGLLYSGPSWLAWLDAVAALVTFLQARRVRSPTVMGTPTWSVVGIGLFLSWLSVEELERRGWLAWANLGLAFGFMLVAVVAALMKRDPDDPRARR